MESVLRGPIPGLDSSLRLLGVDIHALSLQDLNSLIDQAIAQGKRRIIAHHNLHSVYLYYHDIKIRQYFAEADFAHIDGMALVYLGKLLGLPLKREHRTTYVDWLHPLMSEAAQKGWRIFYLGSKPGVGERSAQLLREQFPGLQIATAHGYFDAHPDSAENQAILSEINAYRPDVVIVGMGMPRQEHWVLDNHRQIAAHVILNSGAMMDYAAGEVPTPPRWAGRLGVEWLFRLFAEPNRLWHRYLVEPWFVLKVFLAEYYSRLLSAYS
jgi:N-acetylglucosaminyldiphosphoundecaprenol N-acetyl-beta-D-mannosaminyltransferase